VFVGYTLGLTVASVSVVGEPVVPTPVTSPTNMSVPEGILTGTVVILVTNPLVFTVTLGINVADP